MKNIKTVIGLMSGTSLDGVDVALLQSDGENYVETLETYHMSYPRSFRSQLQQGLIDARFIEQPSDRPGILKQLEINLTLYHVNAVKKLLDKARKTAQDIDLVGFHGQTVLHRPPSTAASINDNYHPFTVQIGSGKLLAQETNILTIADMRSNDMRHGGNGAPLVPVYHRALAQKIKNECTQPIMFINIGGISNGTYIGKKQDKSNDIALIASDYGPGNTLIDQWAEINTGKFYDAGGKEALKGKVLPWLIKAYQALPIFYENRKSFDRLDFQPLDQFLQQFSGEPISYQDGAASLAYITAQAVINAAVVIKEKPKTMIISGGGVKNAAIMQFLGSLGRQYDIEVIPAYALNLDSEFMEAESWAYLAIRSFYGLPLTYPTTTGCDQPVSGGTAYNP